jgi:hypothetical protein
VIPFENRLALAIALLLLAAGPRLGAGPGPGAPEELEPGRPTEVYLAPGRATTIQFRTDDRVAAISVASPVVSYQYDKALNELELTPAVRSPGVETNLNLRIGGNVYILLLKVVGDVRVQYWRCFTLPGGSAADDEAGLGRARPLAPAEVDIVGAAEALVRAGEDPVYRAAHPNLRIEPLGRARPWNDCAVELVDVGQFLDLDLLVFRVRWVNRTSDALYLDPTQVGIDIGDRKIPIVARYKVGIGPIVYPGQVDTVYLAVQGLRLSRRNDWRLVLPPDASELRPP